MGKQRAPRSENRKESSGLWPASHGDGKEVRREAHWLLGEAGLSPHIPSTLGPLLRHPDLPAHRGTAAAAQPSPTLSPCPSNPATCPTEHTGLRHSLVGATLTPPPSPTCGSTCSLSCRIFYLFLHLFPSKRLIRRPDNMGRKRQAPGLSLGGTAGLGRL